MAIEELNAKGVQIGGRTARFELLAEDDAGDPKQDTAAAQKLVDSKVQGAVGSTPTRAASPKRSASCADAPQSGPRREHAREGPGIAAPRPLRYSLMSSATSFRTMQARTVRVGGVEVPA
jgi:hypothetical protein